MTQKITQSTTTTRKTTRTSSNNSTAKKQKEKVPDESKEEVQEVQTTTQQVELILSSTSKKLITNNKRVAKAQSKNVSHFSAKAQATRKQSYKDDSEDSSFEEEDDTINSNNKRIRKNRDQITLLQEAYEANGGSLTSKQQDELSRSLALSKQQIYKWCWDQKKKKQMEQETKKNVCPDEFGGYSKAWLKNQQEQQEEEQNEMEDISSIIGFDVTQKAIDLIQATSPTMGKRFVKKSLESPINS